MKKTLKRTISAVLSIGIMSSAMPIGSNLIGNEVLAETISNSEAGVINGTTAPMTTIPNQTVTAITSDTQTQLNILSTTATIVTDEWYTSNDIVGVATNLDEMPTDENPIRLDMGSVSIFDDYVVVYAVYCTTNYPVSFRFLNKESENEWSINMKEDYSTAPGAGTSYDIMKRYAVGIKIPKELYTGQKITLKRMYNDIYQTATTTESTYPVTGTTSYTTTEDPYPVTGTTVNWDTSYTTTEDPYPVTGTTVNSDTSYTTTEDLYPVTGTTTPPTTTQVTTNATPITGTTPVTGTPPVTSTTNIIDNISGDVNGDGKLDIVDLVMMAKSIMKTTVLTEDMIKAGDTNNDGKITISDMVYAAKQLVQGSIADDFKYYDGYVGNVWRTENKDNTFTPENEGVVIKSSEELQSFINSIDNKDDMSFLVSGSNDVRVEFNNLFENYDDAFFANNNLVICSASSQKGRYAGTNIECNSNTMNIKNTIDCMPTISEDGSLITELDYYTNIILEMPKTDMATIKTVNIQNVYSL